MPNHVHLVVRDLDGVLSSFMQRLNAQYARYINYRYQRVGHLYQGRFHSKMITQDSYLLEVSRYVHLNPVKAALVASPEAYLWSSYRRYVGLDSNPDGLVDRQFILSMMGRESTQQVLAYRQFVEGKMLERLPSWERRLRRLKLLRRVSGTSRAG